jgi:predicted dehydrogenase
MTLRTAVIGVGHLGRWHAQKLRQCEGVELVALCEPNAPRAAEMEKEFSLACVHDLAALPAIDAAVIATPTSHHAEIAASLIRRGVHVLIEKPVVKTEADAKSLATLAADFPGVVVQVGHIERFNPAVMAAQKIFDRPWFMVAERLGPFKPRSLDVDVIDDLMIHDLDLCLAWIGGEVADVRAVGVSVMTQQVDMANARIEFASGAVAQLTASRSSLESSRKLRLFTEERYLSLDLEKKEAKSVRRLKAAEPGGWPEIEGEPITVEPHDALFAEVQAFVRACVTKTPPPVDLQDGLRAVRLAWAVKEKMRTPGIDALERAGMR